MLVWIAKLFRSLFLLIDKVIYWAVNMVYQLFIMISETGIFTPEDIRTFSGRIYVLLGVFMLFKVSFSLITYVLNPDALTDKNKGVSKLLTNFFVVLIGIIAIPYVFQAAYSLQSIVLKGNVIGTLIMGMNSEVMGNNNYNYVEQGGSLMSYTTLSAFIRLNENVVGTECSNMPVVGATTTDPNTGKEVPLYKTDGTRQAEISAECTADAMQVDVNNGGTVESVLLDAYTQNNMYYFTDTDLVNLRANNKDGNEDWIFDYTFIISSIAGGFLAWILLLFCIDVATRSVKLGFLQLIAPIPIISYIDPKSGKDGIFKKWVNQCVKTYVDLFIRLIAIYFAVFVISTLANGRIYNVTTGQTQTNIFVIIFIIFGALMFAKQLPDLISDITGVKLNGGFTLNPMKKLGDVPLVGGAVGAGLTMAGAGLAMAGRAATMPARGLANGLRSAVRGRGFKMGWSESANRTANDLQRRWHHNSMEAQGRLSSTFSSQGYKGETAHQMYKKESDERAKKAIQARYDYGTRRSDWNYGYVSGQQVKKLKTDPAEYRKAGFKSNEFINSMIAIEEAKERTKAAEIAYIQAQQVFESGGGSAADVEAAKSNYTNAQSALESVKDNHDKFMVPRHAEDAALERDRKYAKGSRPGDNKDGYMNP